MRLVVAVAVAVAVLTDIRALPVGNEGQREDVITRCLVEVLSKALSTPDSQLDPECKDILLTGLKHAPQDKKSGEGVVMHEDVVKGQPQDTEAKATDVKDIEALLRSVEEKREIPEDERSQESWSLGDEKEKRHQNGEKEEEREKRGNWRPGRYHQKKYKRGEEEDNERSQESWGKEEKRSEEEEDDEDEEREKRSWRPGRYHQRKHKRDEEPLGGETEEEEERSQESWDVGKRHGNEEEERNKRIWKPTHRYHHKKKFHKRGNDGGEDYEDRSQESWGLDDERDKRDWRPGRYHQRRHKRDEELSEEGREEPEEERSQEYWDFDTGLDKRDWRPGRYHQRRHKRDEELSDEGEEERSQEYWDFDKRHGKEEGEVEKRIWKPTHRYHHKKKFHKRGGGSSEEEEEYDEAAKDKEDALRYLAEKRNPWIYRGYYHPAWFKRDSDEQSATANKMDELAKLLSYRVNQLANHSTQEESKRSLHQRELTPQEGKELENLAAMDVELQKIAAKLHDNSA